MILLSKDYSVALLIKKTTVTSLMKADKISTKKRLHVSWCLKAGKVVSRVLWLFWVFFFASYCLLLVGGWTNPFETYARQIGSFPPNRDENMEIFEPPPSSSCKRLLKIFRESFEDQTTVRAEIILDMTNEQTVCSRPQHIKKSELHLPYNWPTGTTTCQLSVWNPIQSHQNP